MSQILYIPQQRGKLSYYNLSDGSIIVSDDVQARRRFRQRNAVRCVSGNLLDIIFVRQSIDSRTRQRKDPELSPV